MFSKAMLIVFYFILSFCVFLQFEFKIGVSSYVFIPLYLSLISIMINRKHVLSYIILFVCLFLAAVFIFGNLIVDLIFRPTVPALDCSGAVPMNGNWVRGTLFGLLLSIVFITFYIKRLKVQSFNEQVLSTTVLILLTTSIVFPDTFLKLHEMIIRVSMPTIIYPDGC
jgi:vacuolar-type H+-ATPase subunit I/STV1